MSRKGRKFEEDYAWLQDLDSKYKVTSPAFLTDKVTGKKREVDVLLEYLDIKGHQRKIAVECRDRNHKEDVMWIEQLKTKRDDLGLDYLIATTTTDFTDSAIEKARYHGIILEKAEIITEETIEKLEKDFFFDIFFIIPKITGLTFLLKSGKSISYKDLLTKLSVVDKQELLTSLNYDLFLNINFSEFIKSCGLKEEDFFKYPEDTNASIANIVFVNQENAASIIKRIGIISVKCEFFITPHKVSLPLNKSLSTFDVNPKRNKKYKAIFGNNEETVTVGYIDDSTVKCIVHLLKRKGYRCIGGNATINTIFPEKAQLEFSVDNMEETLISTLDYSSIL